MTYSSHVAHKHKTNVFFFFFLKRFASRVYNACNAILARLSNLHELFT